MSEARPALLPLLRSENQLRLLATLLLNPATTFTIGELALVTGIPQPSVSREVAQLTTTSVLRSETVRGRREIRANTDSPIFPELASMLLKTLGPKAVLERLLAGLPGVEQAVIYGSWAHRYHGEPGGQPGDIDVLVVGLPDVALVRGKAERASEELGRDVNVSVLSPAEWNAADSGFLTGVRAGPLVYLDVAKIPTLAEPR